MFRQSIRRCARLSSACFAAPSLRTRPVVIKSFAQPSQIASCVPASINGFKLYSTEAAAVAPEQSADASKDAPLSRFEDLRSLGVHNNLVDSITKGLRYEEMTDVQSKTIKPALEGMDMVAQAKTGTGKTLAFLVPILQRMIAKDPALATRNARYQASSSDIRGIIISPTRELAEQIAVEAEKLCRNTGLVVQRAVGGTQKRQMLYQTRREGCHLLVGTPGRLNDLLGDPDSGIRAPKLAAIVLDEADNMLDVGFEKELNSIVAQLPDPRKTERQTLLFSATIPQNVIQLARSWVRPDKFDFIQTVNPNDVLTHDRVPQHVVNCKSHANMFPTLYELVHSELEKRSKNPDLMPFKAMVFMPTTGFVELASGVDRVMSGLRRQYGSVNGWKIHSKLTQPQRTRSADEFRASKSGILFTSDVTARGLDFPNVTHVIQFGVPHEREQYVHRLGRTARAGKPGEGWLIIADAELDHARKELKGLPIKPNTSFNDAARLDFASNAERSEVTQAVTEATQKVDGGKLSTAYMSIWGRFNVRAGQQLQDSMRDWFVNALEKGHTPYISPAAAAKRNLTRVSGLNHDVSTREDSDGFDVGRGGRGDRFGGDRFGGGRFGGDRFGGRSSGDRFGGRRDGGFNREPRDGFDKMSQQRSGGDRRGDRRDRSSF
ncbi:ATP-dependent RNA helicase cyt-19 [Colletotrichum sidae]|uniref:ATP-dependent RNA helicase n=1 Tax=Colletotrichum sidae TaxID=1347389 RepID=A0A4R8TTC5_9PEZI|nr:ATP-dependent RNA helicase cyt-19 [Colletotrichum sidae]